jgi:hypothetical protein
MPSEDETPMTKERWEKMTPGDKLEYQIQHMADPRFIRWLMDSLDISNPGEAMEYEILQHSRAWKVQKREPLDPSKALKSFDPATVYKILSVLGTPATFSMLKNNKDRLNKSLTATSLRQYLDALLTRRYITIDNVKFKRKDYPQNTIPRKEFSFYFVSTRGGRRYVKQYEKVLEMLSELDPRGRMDRV